MKNIIVIFFICFAHSIFAQEETEIIEVETSYMQELDSKTYEMFYESKWFEEDSLVTKAIYMPKHEINKLSDEEILYFMELLPTSFPLNFNTIVRKNIEQFAENRRMLVAQSLGIGSHYFPIFEEKLNQYNAPLVLKYLPVIESNINPFARSKAGAMGMWQFMPRTGKSLGLVQNDYYDDRRDPYKATDAAVRYLSDLYDIYGDWLLVLAAYNAGPGNVNKAIGISGGKRSFWEIRPYLPNETKNYVPRFIACVFVMEYYEKYEILPQKPLFDFFMTDTITIYDKLSLRFIGEMVGIDSAYLHFVNPALKKGIVPKTETGFAINIPIDFVGQFAALKDFMYEDPYLIEVEAEVIEVAEPKYTVYKVKSGDTLGHIGMKYGVGVSQIKKWNSLKSDNLKIGQKLVLYI